jgi:hypothetical protein
LARDNADSACAACQSSSRRDRAPEVPRELWQTPAMLDALASGELGRVIRAYRAHPFHGPKPLRHAACTTLQILGCQPALD